MHDNSYELMRGFCDTWVRKGHTVLDVGAYDVNGTYKNLFANCRYLGADIAPGPNVDVVTGHYSYPFDDDHFDIVISGQTLEHSQHPWKIVAEMARVLKKGGKMCVIAPWRWPVHYHPLDCFRILPDGMTSMLSDAGMVVLKSFISHDDTCAIAHKPL